MYADGYMTIRYHFTEVYVNSSEPSGFDILDADFDGFGGEVLDCDIEEIEIYGEEI